MVFNWLYQRLKKKAFKERHKVTRLEWEKALLEKKIAEAKERSHREE